MLCQVRRVRFVTIVITTAPGISNMHVCIIVPGVMRSGHLDALAVPFLISTKQYHCYWCTAAVLLTYICCCYAHHLDKQQQSQRALFDTLWDKTRQDKTARHLSHLKPALLLLHASKHEVGGLLEMDA